MKVILAGITFIFIACFAATAAAPPKLADYPAKTIFKGKAAEPVLSTPKARMFRTELRRQAAAGPNFAGQFTLALWACGTGCNTIAVIETRSGTVYGPDVQFEAIFDRSAQPTCYISSRGELGSELFFAQGRIGDKVGRHYFHWKEGKFRLVHFEPTCVDSAEDF